MRCLTFCDDDGDGFGMPEDITEHAHNLKTIASVEIVMIVFLCT